MFLENICINLPSGLKPSQKIVVNCGGVLHKRPPQKKQLPWYITETPKKTPAAPTTKTPDARLSLSAPGHRRMVHMDRH